MNLNAIDIGAAYRPENQDPTLTSTVPGQAAYTTNLLRPYRGLADTNQNTTRIVYVGDPGSGCFSDLYRQFNVTAVTGPSYGSVGLESGRNQLRGCPDKTVDLSMSRDIRIGGGRKLEFRVDAFNAFNTVVISGRSTGIQYNSPTDLTIRNSQTLPDGSMDPNRLTPRTAGFGAATAALPLRSMQVQLRFAF